VRAFLILPLMVAGAGQRLLLLRQDGVIYVHQQYNLFNHLHILALSPEAHIPKAAGGRAFGERSAVSPARSGDSPQVPRSPRRALGPHFAREGFAWNREPA
jgi:hypothetical protein